MKIVAVSGSLTAGGNVEALLDYALEEYANKSDVEVEKFLLSKMEIAPCKQCNWCLRNQTESRFCKIDDGMGLIYPELMEASGLIVATPVHFLRLSPTTANFLDRLRPFVHGNITAGAMRNKVGGALAVSWFRNAGIELALVTVNAAFQALTMVIATPDLGAFGGGAFSSINGTGERLEGDKRLVLQDELGLATARSVAYRVWELVTILEAGKKLFDDREEKQN